MAYKKYNHVPNNPGFPAVGGDECISSADVYKYVNNFDYSKWIPGTRVKLCNVTWDGNENVVCFNDANARDEWLNTRTGNVVELKTATRLLPDGMVTLPLPFDACFMFNYCVVDFPDAPVDMYTDNRITRWCFFAEAVESKSPNTTVVALTVDWWQTFIYNVKFNYAILERGHAPMAAITATEYLKSPIQNNKYLLSEDVNFGETEIAKYNHFTPINDEYLFCFAVPMTLTQLANATQPGAISEYGKPTYSDSGDRWGDSYNVTGYGWDTAKDYSNVKTENTTVEEVANAVYAGVQMYALQSKANATAFVKALEDYAPEVLFNLKGAYAIPAKFVQQGNTAEMQLGDDVYTVSVLLPAKNTLDNIELTTDKFGFDSRYAEYAKLYTFPYSAIEVSNENGETATVKIENTQGNINVAAQSAVAFPYVSITAYIDNIGGIGVGDSYMWRMLDGSNVEQALPLGEWRNLLWKYDIPTIALFGNGYTNWQLHNANTAKDAARYNALKSYHNAVRSANTAQQNALVSAATAQTNTNASAETGYSNAVSSAATAQTNTNASAETGYSNAVSSAATAQTNTNASAETGYSNAVSSAAAAKTNTEQSAAASYAQVVNNTNTENTNAALSRAKDSYITAKCAEQSTIVTNWSNELTTANTNEDIGYNEAVTGIDTATDAIAGVANAAASAVGGFVVGGAGGAAVGAATSAVSSIVGIAKEQLLLQAMVNNANVKLTHSVSNASGITEVNNSYANSNQDHVNSTAETITSNSINNAKANANVAKTVAEANAQRSYDNAVSSAEKSQTTANANAARSYDTSVANANRSKSTTEANAARSYDTSVANANRSKSTTEANAARSYDTSVANTNYSQAAQIRNLQAELEAAQQNAMFTAQDRKNDNVIQICAANGDTAPDINKWRGLQVQIKTQNNNAIECAATQFARFGYMLNQPWVIETLNVMPHFTYWKCTDVWVLPGEGIMEKARETVRSILRAGVTVWRKPEEIGAVEIWQ